MPGRIARLPRIWQIWRPSLRRRTGRRDLHRGYFSTDRTASTDQNCCIFVASFTCLSWSRRDAYSSSASRSAAATAPWVGRTQAVGHRVTPLVRMNSATAASQSFSGTICRNLASTMECPVLDQSIIRIGFAGGGNYPLCLPPRRRFEGVRAAITPSDFSAFRVLLLTSIAQGNARIIPVGSFSHIADMFSAAANLRQPLLDPIASCR
jgi:hypothetical protein